MSGTIKQRLPFDALRRRQIAASAWVYLIFIALATVMLGTFVVAFMASLKVDPLERPFRLVYDQVMPNAWFAAADLGRQGAGDPLWGGFAPGGAVTFAATYTAPPGVAIEEPEAEVPRRRPGTGLAAAVMRDFASDYALLSLDGVEDGEMVVTDDETGEDQVWPTRRFTYRIAYDPAKTEGPWIERTPLNLVAPTSQSLVSSDLAPTRFERRGRVASWDNITPGALGLIFNNYRRVITETVDLSTGNSLFAGWLWNSFAIAIGRVLMTITLASLAGYALARLKFTGAGLIFGVVLFSMTIPAQVTFISNYLIFRDLGLLNTQFSVVVVLVVGSHVLLMKQFFESFPKEIEEAAIVDGTSRFGVFWRIVLPNSMPAIIVNAIMAFQAAWNDFFWPLVLLTSPPNALTVQVGLLSLRRSYGGAQGDWGLVLAGAFISIVPVLVLFILFQRYIVSNQVSEGVK
ncbi:MAG: ABC transporter permease [Pelagibacterium sp. SCN 64-44]|nr:MAG: ABC transporter permease [Pelagibacterium sp. SCN 64-44]